MCRMRSTALTQTTKFTLPTTSISTNRIIDTTLRPEPLELAVARSLFRPKGNTLLTIKHGRTTDMTRKGRKPGPGNTRLCRNQFDCPPMMMLRRRLRRGAG